MNDENDISSGKKRPCKPWAEVKARYYVSRETAQKIADRPVTTDEENDVHMMALDLMEYLDAEQWEELPLGSLEELSELAMKSAGVREVLNAYAKVLPRIRKLATTLSANEDAVKSLQDGRAADDKLLEAKDQRISELEQCGAAMDKALSFLEQALHVKGKMRLDHPLLKIVTEARLKYATAHGGWTGFECPECGRCFIASDGTARQAYESHECKGQSL